MRGCCQERASETVNGGPGAARFFRASTGLCAGAGNGRFGLRLGVVDNFREPVENLLRAEAVGRGSKGEIQSGSGVIFRDAPYLGLRHGAIRGETRRNPVARRLRTIRLHGAAYRRTHPGRTGVARRGGVR